MNDLLIVYPHGLGDCILLTPALKAYFKKYNKKAALAIMERFKSAELLNSCPYISDILHTKDAWNDFANSHIGFQVVFQTSTLAAKKKGIENVIMPMHQEPESKILLNAQFLDVLDDNFDSHTEIYTTIEDIRKANEVVKELVGGDEFGFIHSKTGLPVKDLPDNYGRNWLRESRGLNRFIEVGEEIKYDDFNINVQFEIMRQAKAVCLADSVFYHACGAIDKPVDFVYFGRGEGVYNRVKPVHNVVQNIVYRL